LAAAGLIAMTSNGFAQNSDQPKAEKAPSASPPAANESEKPKEASPAPDSREKEPAPKAEQSKPVESQQTQPNRDAKAPSPGSEKGVREASPEAPKSTEKATSGGKSATSRDERSSTKATEKSSDRETDRPARTERDGSTTTERTQRESARTSVRAGADANVDVQVDKLRPADMGLWLKSSNDALVISDVERSGPIAKVGFREGDRIVSVNGERIRSERDFITYIFAEDVRRERVKVIVLRDDREEVVYIEPIVFIEEMHVVENDPLEEYGIIVDDRHDDQIVVWKVIPRSPAYYAGIRAGDVIVIFDGQDVSAPSQLVTLVQKIDADRVSVTVQRDRKDRELDLDLTEVRGESRSEARTERATERREVRQENREERREEREEATRNEAVPRAATQTAPAPTAQPQRNSTPANGNNQQRGVLPRPFNR